MQICGILANNKSTLPSRGYLDNPSLESNRWPHSLTRNHYHPEGVIAYPILVPRTQQSPVYVSRRIPQLLPLYPFPPSLLCLSRFDPFASPISSYTHGIGQYPGHAERLRALPPCSSIHPELGFDDSSLNHHDWPALPRIYYLPLPTLSTLSKIRGKDLQQ